VGVFGEVDWLMTLCVTWSLLLNTLVIGPLTHHNPYTHPCFMHSLIHAFVHPSTTDCSLDLSSHPLIPPPLFHPFTAHHRLEPAS
jgi:hypothetical protein